MMGNSVDFCSTDYSSRVQKSVESASTIRSVSKEEYSNTKYIKIRRDGIGILWTVWKRFPIPLTDSLFVALAKKRSVLIFAIS